MGPDHPDLALHQVVTARRPGTHGPPPPPLRLARLTRERRPRPEGGEKAVLAEYVDRYRMTFELKCEGLTAVQLAAR